MRTELSSFGKVDDPSSSVTRLRASPGHGRKIAEEKYLGPESAKSRTRGEDLSRGEKTERVEGEERRRVAWCRRAASVLTGSRFHPRPTTRGKVGFSFEPERVKF